VFEVATARTHVSMAVRPCGDCSHFSTTGFAVPANYSRLYGPWLTLFASGDPADPAAMLSAARAAAQAEINASLTGLEWMQHRLYAPPANRSTVVGFLEIDSGRSFSPFYVVLTPDAHGETDVYRLRESTYWTVCDMNSKFVIPGVPAGEDYTMLVFDNGGSLSETFVQTRVAVLPGGGTTNLGALRTLASSCISVRDGAKGSRRGTSFDADLQAVQNALTDEEFARIAPGSARTAPLAEAAAMTAAADAVQARTAAAVDSASRALAELSQVNAEKPKLPARIVVRIANDDGIVLLESEVKVIAGGGS
jgi:hypothetical protein